MIMKIGVIGIGEIGGTLARKWKERGHSVRVANSRGAIAVKAFAEEIGAEATDVYGAVEGVDAVLLSMPFPAVAKLPKDLFNKASGNVVIIDTANYYPEVRDPHIPEVDDGMPESVWASQQLGRPIIKAFNSIMFYTLSELGRPEGSPDRLAIPVAGDDDHAKQIVMNLVSDTGFEPVNGGLLDQSWRQQPLTPSYCCDYGAQKTLEGLGAAVKGKAAGIRDTEWRSGYMKLFANNPSYADVHAELIALHRSLNPF
jgi:8-hydroxy-5-deazaflavin:NADPH oxidoreductase